MALWPEVSVTPAASRGELPLADQVLIPPCLVNTTGEPLSRRDIDVRRVTEGRVTESASPSRVKKPFWYPCLYWRHSEMT